MTTDKPLLSKGDKLYQVVYWSPSLGRKMEHVTIKKVNPKTLEVYFYRMRLPLAKVGEEWFISREDAIKKAIWRHQVAADGLLATIEPSRRKQLLKQISSLKRWLQKVKEARPVPRAK